MKKILFKHWPVIFIVAVWLVFAHPYFFLGKVPFPSNYLVNFFAPWNTVSEFAGPYKNGATPDVITQIYPWKKLVVDFWKSGTIPLWNPYSFSGTPLLANNQSAALSPVNLLFFILPFIDAWSISVLLQPLLAGLFTYLFVRAIGLGKPASVFSAISFMFCGFITVWMSYQTLAYAILFLPLGLFSIEKFFSSKKNRYLVLLSLTIPLSIFSGHFQTSLYCLLFTIFYLLFKTVTVEKQNRKLTIPLFSSIIFGLMLSAPQILPSIELYMNSVRSELFIALEVIPWIYTPTFIAPDFFGNPVTRNDFLGHYAEWNSYIGLLPLILAFYAPFYKKFRNYAILFFSIGLISVLLAYQTPLLDILVSLKVPVLSTSAASRIIVLASFSFAILAGFGLEKALVDIKDRKFRHLAVLISSFGLIFAIIWAIIIFGIFLPHDRISISFSNFRLSTVIFLSLIVVLIGAKVAKHKKSILVVTALLLFIAAFDSLRFAIKWQPFDPRKYVYPDLPISKFLTNIPSRDRVFGNFGGEAAMTYRVSVIEGYDPLYIGRYGEFIRASSDGKFHKALRSAVVFPKKGENTDTMLNYLGVKYLIHKVADGRNVWTYPFWEYPIDQFKMVYEDASYQVFENQKVFPRALLIGDYRIESSAKKLLESMFVQGADLKKVVYLERDPSVARNQNIKGEAVIKKHSPNKIEIESSASDRGFVVLSDPFYPGWRVYVDGVETKILRADFAFRAVIVPKGKHYVVFKYDPDSFKIGILLGLFGLSGMLGQGLILRRK